MITQLIPYDQTQVQKDTLGDPDADGYCESAVCYWHARTSSLRQGFRHRSEFDIQSVVLGVMATSRVQSAYVRLLQDSDLGRYQITGKYTGARLDGMKKYYFLQKRAEKLNADYGCDLSYDLPAPRDCGPYSDDLNDSVMRSCFNQIMVPGTMCYLMLRGIVNGGETGHGLGTYFDGYDLYIFDPNKGVAKSSKLAAESAFKDAIKYVRTNTALKNLTKFAVIRAK